MPDKQILELSGRFEGSAVLNARLNIQSERLADLTGFTAGDSDKAHARISSWRDYQVTPLHRLPATARHLGLGALYCKGEIL